MTDVTKDPSAVLDYSWDWSGWLQQGETITAQTITAPAGITLEASPAVSQSAGIVTAWLSGGTANVRYPVVCHITTSAGRQDDRTLNINVIER